MTPRFDANEAEAAIFGPDARLAWETPAVQAFVAQVRAATERRRAEEAKPKSAEEIALDRAFGKMVPK